MDRYEFSKETEEHIIVAGKKNYNAGNNLKSALRELDSLRSFPNRFPARFEVYRYVQDHCIDSDEESSTFRVALYEDVLISTGKRKIGWKVRNAEARFLCFPLLKSIKNYSDLSDEQLNNLVRWLSSDAMKEYTYSDSNPMLTPREYKRLKDERDNVFTALIKSNGWSQKDTQEHFKFKTQFTKEHAYELGHLLRFDYAKMEDFIKRVFKEEMFISRNATDLIQSYAFKKGLTQEDAKALLDSYQRLKRNSRKSEGTEEQEELVPLNNERTTELHTEAVEYKGDKTQFLNWLLDHSDELDQFSQTAFYLYKNLLSCAYLMLLIKYRLYYIHGKDVESLQTALNIIDEIKYHCPTDGIYDENTESVVRKFQHDHSDLQINATGILGPAEKDIIISELEKIQESTEAEIESIHSVNCAHLLTRNDKMESNNEVLAYQRALKFINIDRFGCKPDGIFGKDTESVVKIYQRSRGLKVTGYITVSEYISIEKDVQSTAEKINARIQKCMSSLGSRTLFVNHNALQKILSHNPGLPEYLYDEEIDDIKEIRKKCIHILWETCIEEKEDMTAFFDNVHDDFFQPDFKSLDWKKVCRKFRDVSLNDFFLYLTTDTSGQWKINNIFDRIPLLMAENRKTEIEKPDLLCLLYLIYAFDMKKEQNKDENSEQIDDFIEKASTFLEECHFYFYQPAITEYSIIRAMTLFGLTQDIQDTYSTLLTMGDDSPLLIDICIKIPKDRKRIAIRFYGCEEGYADFGKLLYRLSLKMEKKPNTNIQEYIKAILVAASAETGCGWEAIKRDTIPEYFWTFILDEDGIITPDEMDICIKIPATKKDIVGIHIYSYRNRCSDFSKLLYKHSANMKKEHYTDTRKYVEDILVAACTEIKCDWKEIKKDAKPNYFWTFILNEDGLIIPEQRK